MKTNTNIILILALLMTNVSFSQQANLSTEKLWVVKDTIGNYHVNNNSGKTWVLFSGSSYSGITWKKGLKSENQKPLMVKASPSEKMFFAALQGGDTVFISERHIPLSGTPNLRDIGGLPAANNRYVKWGLIYRSGAIDKLSAPDLAYWKSLQIKEVVDFRNDTEIQNAPDKYPGNYDVKYVRAQIGISSSKTENNSARFMAMLKSDTTSATTARNMMIDVNRNMVANIKDFKPLFDELIANSGQKSLLFHCSAGKDRTGLASALILSALGVPEDVIVEEYTLTNKYFKPYAMKNGTLNQYNPAVSAVVMSAEPEYIRAALNEMKSKYGSVQNCLEQEIGLDEEKRQILIQSYTY
jgi:protein-tyrosine phosphatase